MNHELVTIDGNHYLLEHLNFQKKLLCLCLMIHNLLSINENIQLSINDISSNTNNFHVCIVLLKHHIFHHLVV
jgi:hypothetical protein